jgi:hypothetical protein
MDNLLVNVCAYGAYEDVEYVIAQGAVIDALGAVHLRTDDSTARAVGDEAAADCACSGEAALLCRS